MPTNATLPAPADLASRLWASAVLLTRGARPDGGPFTPTQLSVAATVLRCGPVALNELATTVRLSPAMISRVIQGLEREGIVRKRQPSSDRRVALAEVTPTGRDRIAAALAAHHAALAHRLGDLDECEYSQLVAALPLLERLAELPGAVDPG